MTVKHDTSSFENGWCGPAMISAVTGITAEKAASMYADLRNEKNDRRPAYRRKRKVTGRGIRGVYCHESREVLRRLGYKMDTYNAQVWTWGDRVAGRWPTTNQVFGKLRGMQGTYVVRQANSSGGHYLTVKNGTAYDNNNCASNKGTSLGAVRKRRKQVKQVIEITQIAQPKPAPKPAPKPVAKPWSEAQPKSQLSMF